MDVANFFLARRKELDLSQRRIAILLDMTDSAVGSWEREEAVPRLSLAAKLATVYQVSRDRIEREIVAQSRRIAASETTATK